MIESTTSGGSARIAATARAMARLTASVSSCTAQVSDAPDPDRLPRESENRSGCKIT